ncbi:MAG: hypothetical protein AABW49_04330 [Nanoarchaeota archaeon]
MIENLTLGVLIIAALADSINPCVFGVLIFLIAFMFKVYNKPHKMLIGGLFYTLVVYVTYLLIGLGLIKFTVSFGFTKGFYWFAAIIAILAGLSEIKDYFWYGRWFSLQMLPGGARKVKEYTNKIAKIQKHHPTFSIFLTAALGIFVVLVELPCTGAPYLAVIALISQGAYAKAVPLLVLYNIIFILPLLVIIGLAYYSKTSKMLEEWRKEHKGLMRLFIGLFLITLGIYMLYYIATI